MKTLVHQASKTVEQFDRSGFELCILQLPLVEPEAANKSRHRFPLHPREAFIHTRGSNLRVERAPSHEGHGQVLNEQVDAIVAVIAIIRDLLNRCVSVSASNARSACSLRKELVGDLLPTAKVGAERAPISTSWNHHANGALEVAVAGHHLQSRGP